MTHPATNTGGAEASINLNRWVAENQFMMAGQAGQADDKRRYAIAADKLHAAYFDAFYNPATGILAGWRSADGQLHDYYFLWVNGIAIHYGLVPADKANSIMDHLLAKMKQVGCTRFDLGLPGNLIPVAKKDEENAVTENEMRRGFAPETGGNNRG
jgi:hypothetical protein